MESITTWTEYKHLNFPWKCHWSQSRQSEVTITRFRCRVPPLNFYLHRAGLTLSPLCQFCGELENIAHFFLSCRRYAIIRSRLLITPLLKIGLNLTEETVLSFGASGLGYCHRDAFDAVCNFMQTSKRVPSWLQKYSILKCG